MLMQKFRLSLKPINMSLSATIECAQKREVEGQWEEDSTAFDYWQTKTAKASQSQPKTAYLVLTAYWQLIGRSLAAYWQSENLIQKDQNFDLNRSEQKIGKIQAKLDTAWGLI